MHECDVAIITWCRYDGKTRYTDHSDGVIVKRSSWETFVRNRKSSHLIRITNHLTDELMHDETETDVMNILSSHLDFRFCFSWQLTTKSHLEKCLFYPVDQASTDVFNMQTDLVMTRLILREAPDDWFRRYHDSVQLAQNNIYVISPLIISFSWQSLKCQERWDVNWYSKLDVLGRLLQIMKLFFCLMRKGTSSKDVNVNIVKCSLSCLVVRHVKIESWSQNMCLQSQTVDFLSSILYSWCNVC